LVTSRKAKFDLLAKKGKLLSNLLRNKDAIFCLEQVMIEYEEIKDSLSPKDRGHVAISQYALCNNYSLEAGSTSKYRKKMLHHWKQAELKRSQLPDDIIAHLDWGYRDVAQIIVASIKPDAALSHRECHFCHIVTDNAKTCSACKAVVYCSKECQIKHWRAGHKTECKKVTKVHKTLLDENLVPQKLWEKGLQMLNAGNPDEAMWNFLVALFMDFSLDVPQNVVHIKKAVDLAIANDPNQEKLEAMALSMVCHYQLGMSQGDIVAFCCNVLEKMPISLAKLHKQNVTTPTQVPTKLDEVNRNLFSMGVAYIFTARWLSRCNGAFDVSRKRNREAVENTVDLISQARTFLDPEQWLTYTFELGYSHFDIMALDKGKIWLKKFVDTLINCERSNGPLSNHWQGHKKNAEDRLGMIPMMEVAAQMFGPNDCPF